MTIWSWPSSSACRVWPMNAATSLPRKFSPSPRPTTSGLLRRAPTTTPGLSACTARRVKAPSSRCTTLSMASVRSPTRSYSRPTSLAATSVSVSERNTTPSASSSFFRAWKFSMMPLWIRASRSCVATAVRVRVAVGGAAVGRPAGVPDAGARGGQRVRLERRAEVLELAGALLGRDAVGGDQGDARRVVPAVLEPGEPFHHDLEGRVIHGPPDVAHDSAHAGKPSCEPPRVWPAGRPPTVGARHTGAPRRLRSGRATA